MRIGTMTTLFRERRNSSEHISYLESMRRCHQAGFQVLDFNMCSSIRRETELTGDDWEQQIHLMKEEAMRLGVEFSQSHPPYRPFKGVSFASCEEQERFDELTRRAIVASEILGVKWAVLHPVTDDKAEYSSRANLDANHRAFDWVAELAENAGVGLAFENMCDRENYRRFGTTAEELIMLTDSYNLSHIGICWDVGHAHRSHFEQSAAIRSLGHRLKATHIDDNLGETDLHLLPFMGTAKWEDVISALHDVEYRGDLIYEITTNHRMPDALQDLTARYTYEVGQYLLSL